MCFQVQAALSDPSQQFEFADAGVEGGEEEESAAERQTDPLSPDEEEQPQPVPSTSSATVTTTDDWIDFYKKKYGLQDVPLLPDFPDEESVVLDQRLFGTEVRFLAHFF